LIVEGGVKVFRTKTYLLLIGFISLFLTTQVCEKAECYEVGNWNFTVNEDVFGKKKAMLICTSRDIDATIIIKCNKGLYSITITQSRKIPWMQPVVPVQYKIGPDGEMKKELWTYDPSFNITELDDASVMIEKMKAAPGHLILKSLADEFKPSLIGFTKAINKLDKYCK
jgi:hypothetical protein